MALLFDLLGWWQLFGLLRLLTDTENRCRELLSTIFSKTPQAKTVLSAVRHAVFTVFAERSSLTRLFIHSLGTLAREGLRSVFGCCPEGSDAGLDVSQPLAEASSGFVL